MITASLSIEIFTQENSHVRMLIAGVLDANSFEAFETALLNTFQLGCRRLVVDLSGINYLSSAGAGVLVNAYVHAQEAGIRLEIVALSDCALEIFHFSGLLPLIDAA